MEQRPSKQTVGDLARFGGAPLFPVPISTSNLVKPDEAAFFRYSRLFYNQHRYSDNGPLVRLLEQRLAAFHQAERCIAFANGFWALVLTVKCLAIAGRTEVVMPSLTYRRLADIVAWTGLVPRFCDVDPETLALGVSDAAACISQNSALLLAVHPIVNCCDAPGLVALAQRSGIPLLFDSVESVYETIGGQKVGSFGDAECFSLHASKLINGFEGGYVTTNNLILADRLAKMPGFGFSDRDNVEDFGFNAKLNEVHAAMALAGLDDVEAQVERNRVRYRTYQRALTAPPLPGIRLLPFDEREKTSYKNIVVEVGDEWPLSRDVTVALLNGEGVLARAYYAPPLHQRPVQYRTIAAELPETDRLARRFMLLPCGHFVNDADIADVARILCFLRDNAPAIRSRLP